jgi:catechol 2,3-dioxygenase-like lactoylglutathione lyase family enzyme
MPLVCKYIALYVPDLRRAADLYARMFGMELAFRETERHGEWWTVPADTSWDDVEAAGVDVRMAALRRDELVLAVFAGSPTPGTVHEICLGLPDEELARLRDEPPDGVKLAEQSEGFLRLDDPFGFRWVVQAPESVFRSSGEIADRWLLF